MDVKEGDPLCIVSGCALVSRVHFGGMLYADIETDLLLLSSREADADELKKELKHCLRCNRIELDGRWLPKPPCFSPRETVKLVPQNCPECDV